MEQPEPPDGVDFAVRPTDPKDSCEMMTINVKRTCNRCHNGKMEISYANDDNKWEKKIVACYSCHGEPNLDKTWVISEKDAYTFGEVLMLMGGMDTL